MMNKQWEIQYGEISDHDLVNQVLDGDEDAMLYLLYNRYKDSVSFYCNRYFSEDRLESLTYDVFIHLKGNDGSWKRLRSFQWKSQFSTWLSAIVARLFNSEYKKDTKHLNRSQSYDDYLVEVSDNDDNNMKYVALLECINQLRDPEYRMILLKEIEGYSPDEIAEMLKQKRIAEGRVRKYKGKVTYPTTDYVYTAKSKAVKELRCIYNQDKEVCYGGK